MTTILPFQCPHCNCENGRRFLYPKSGEDSAFCVDCGYNHYYEYRKENGAYFKIDETKELNYGNIQYVKHEINIPYAVYNIAYQNGISSASNLNNIEAYHEFVESFQKEQSENILKVTVNRFYENELHKTVLYENPNAISSDEDTGEFILPDIFGKKDNWDDLPF